MDIQYKRNVGFLGRNGRFKQSGLSIRDTYHQRICFQPITGKGMNGNCMIEVPIENVPAVIAALQEIMREKSTKI